VGDRRVDVDRLLGDLALALGGQVVERAHVVGAVGELDQDDADVARHGQHHLAEVLRLLLFAAVEIHLADLGDAVDQRGDLLAELGVDLLDRRQRVLDGVVQEAGDDARDVELEVGDQAGDADRVDEVRVAGLAALAAVHLAREVIGAPDERGVGAAVVGAHAADQFFGAGHAPAPGARPGAGAPPSKRRRAAATSSSTSASGVRSSVDNTRS
jgi:hypothetical protein